MQAKFEVRLGPRLVVAVGELVEGLVQLAAAGGALPPALSIPPPHFSFPRLRANSPAHPSTRAPALLGLLGHLGCRENRTTAAGPPCVGRSCQGPRELPVHTERQGPALRTESRATRLSAR